MGEEFTEKMTKVQRLIEMAKENPDIQEKLKSGEKDLVMPILEEVGLSEQDVADLVGELDTITTSVKALGFWRFGA